MYTIIDQRDTHKTRRLIEIAKREDQIIVCANPMRLKDKARAYGIGFIEAISYDDWKARVLEGNPPENYVIDDITEFLKSLGCNGFTASID